MFQPLLLLFIRPARSSLLCSRCVLLSVALLLLLQNEAEQKYKLLDTLGT